MNINHLVSTNGAPSGTKTLLTITVLVMLVRGAASGITVGGTAIAEIPQTLHALADIIWPLAGVYGFRRFSDAKYGVGPQPDPPGAGAPPAPAAAPAP